MKKEERRNRVVIPLLWMLLLSILGMALIGVCLIVYFLIMLNYGIELNSYTIWLSVSFWVVFLLIVLKIIIMK